MLANRERRYQQDWEEWALLDPMWGICTRADMKYGKWADGEFFDSGRSEIEGAFRQMEAIAQEVCFGRALDFGCGAGRLSRALSCHFNEVVGVDSSRTMISIARKLHQGNSKIIFYENQGHDLKLFSDNEFDFVLSLITLQHIPDGSTIKHYLQEFLRVAKPGGIIHFSLPTIPDYSQLKESLLKVRGALYSCAVALGLTRIYLYHKLRLKPFMYMNYLPAREVEQVCRSQAETFVVLGNKTVDTRYFMIKKFNAPACRI